jgi:hypothetical protein
VSEVNEKVTPQLVERGAERIARQVWRHGRQVPSSFYNRVCNPAQGPAMRKALMPLSLALAVERGWLVPVLTITSYEAGPVKPPEAPTPKPMVGPEAGAS